MSVVLPVNGTLWTVDIEARPKRATSGIASSNTYVWFRTKYAVRVTVGSESVDDVSRMSTDELTRLFHRAIDVLVE